MISEILMSLALALQTASADLPRTFLLGRDLDILQEDPSLESPPEGGSTPQGHGASNGIWNGIRLAVVPLSKVRIRGGDEEGATKGTRMNFDAHLEFFPGFDIGWDLKRASVSFGLRAGVISLTDMRDHLPLSIFGEGDYDGVVDFDATLAYLEPRVSYVAPSPIGFVEASLGLRAQHLSFSLEQMKESDWEFGENTSHERHVGFGVVYPRLSLAWRASLSQSITAGVMLSFGTGPELHNGQQVMAASLDIQVGSAAGVSLGWTVEYLRFEAVADDVDLEGSMVWFSPTLSWERPF
ncbi:MAG: hypothetical protein HYY16_13855 [Planctomycetes bacterium]|nr:hypothetical protein [Planctomycetota bacterium]